MATFGTWEISTHCGSRAMALRRRELILREGKSGNGSFACIITSRVHIDTSTSTLLAEV